MLDYEIVLKSFKKYLENFDANDENIARKISHSYHVADLMRKLARKMELTEEDTFLAAIIGVLHDIGRFKQYKIINCYNDNNPDFEHGLLAVEYLFKENHIEDFKIPKKYHNIIAKSIENHSQLTIKEGLNKQELFFSKLIRDVDKIDLFRVFSTNYVIHFKEKPSLEVKKMFDKHQSISKKLIVNESDSILCTLAFVFDINFKQSFELLRDTDNLELYLSMIEVERGFESDFEEIKSEIRKFLEERIEE